VQAEHVQAVIGPQQALETMHAPQTGHAAQQAYDEGTTDTDETGGRE
jgi:hypothetical protein